MVVSGIISKAYNALMITLAFLTIITLITLALLLIVELRSRSERL